MMGQPHRENAEVLRLRTRRGNTVVAVYVRHHAALLPQQRCRPQAPLPALPPPLLQPPRQRPRDVAWSWSDVGTLASLEVSAAHHRDGGRAVRPLSPAAAPRAATLRRRARNRTSRLSPPSSAAAVPACCRPPHAEYAAVPAREERREEKRRGKKKARKESCGSILFSLTYM